MAKTDLPVLQTSGGKVPSEEGEERNRCGDLICVQGE
jgi:hypothetical protein